LDDDEHFVAERDKRSLELMLYYNPFIIVMNSNKVALQDKTLRMPVI
jgi:hypothetical protein